MNSLFSWGFSGRCKVFKKEALMMIFLIWYITIFIGDKLCANAIIFSYFFAEEIHMYSKINRNIYKPPVSEATKEIVRKNFTREIEFFEFCKQRLHKQYMALNLNGLEAQP